MAGNPWTTQEDRYLRQYYPRRGPKHCTRFLNRTESAIRNRAQALGLLSGVPKGYVPLVWVAPKRGHTNVRPSALRQAREANALLVLPGRWTKYAVTIEWADQYAAQEEADAALRNQTATWLTTRDIATLANVHHSTITQLHKRKAGIGRHLAQVERVEVTYPTRHYRWHPHQARNAIRAWRANQ